MKRLLLVLLTAALLPLGLSATQIDPAIFYRVVLAHDKPESWHPDAWRQFVQVMSGLNGARADGNSIFYTHDKMLGKHLLERLDPNDIGNKLVAYRLVSADPLPAAGDPSKPAEPKPKTPPAPRAPEGNGPLTEEDRRGKPVHYAGSSEAQAQARESAARQDKAVAKFKQSGAWGNGPVSGEGLLGKTVHYAGSPEANAQARQSAVEQDKAVAKFKQSGAPGNGPVSGEGLLGKPVGNTGKDEEEAAGARDEFETPSTGVSPRKQGTKKDDTLFKNQNQNNPPQFQAPDNFIGIWTYPQDSGTGDEDYRLVYVQLTGKEKPTLMSLKKAKDAGYVPQSTKYRSLPAYPQ